MFIWIYEQIKKGILALKSGWLLSNKVQTGLKRCMSLVLVVAMLAGFVGMSGYVPGAIKAEAAFGSAGSSTADRKTQGGVAYKQISGYGAATSGKPSGSNAAANTLTKLDVPPVLYTDNGVIINNTGRADNYSDGSGSALDTTIDVIAPSGTTKITVHIVRSGSDTIIRSESVNGSSGSFDLNGLAESTISPDDDYVYYRIDYIVNGITYSQYAASYVRVLPIYKGAVAAASVYNSKKTDPSRGCGMYQRVNFSNVLYTPGFDLAEGVAWEGSASVLDLGGPFAGTGYDTLTSDTTYARQFFNKSNGDYALGQSNGVDDKTYVYYHDVRGVDGIGHFYPGYDNTSDNKNGNGNGTARNTAMRAKIIVDISSPSAAAGTTFRLPVITVVKGSAHVRSDHHSAKIDESYYSFFRYGASGSSAADSIATATSWYGDWANELADQTNSGANGSLYNATDSNLMLFNNVARSATSPAYSGEGGNQGHYMSNAIVARPEYVSATGSGNYAGQTWEFYRKEEVKAENWMYFQSGAYRNGGSYGLLMTPYSYYEYLKKITDTTGSGTNKIEHDRYEYAIDTSTNIRWYFSYRFDFITVNRQSSRDVISAAINNNYIKAEMDDAWWSNYRTLVLNAYKNVGNLTTTADPFALSNNIGAPVYAGANLDSLYSALNAGVPYDAGNYNRTYNSNANCNIPNGAQWTALGNNTGDADIKLGAYYYTDATWQALVKAKQKLFICANASTMADFNSAASTTADTSANSMIYGTLKYYGGTDGTTKNGLLYCYCQATVNTYISDYNTAKTALVLKPASYSSIYEALEKAGISTHYITTDTSGNYNINYKLHASGAISRYYDASGNQVSYSGGELLPYTYYTAASLAPLQTAIRNRLAVYDFAAENRLNDNTLVYNYHSVNGTTIDPVPETFNMPPISVSDAPGYETRLAANENYHMLAIGYQARINDAAKAISDAADGLKLNVWAYALAKAVDEAILDDAGNNRLELESTYNKVTFAKYKAVLDYASKVLSQVDTVTINTYWETAANRYGSILAYQQANRTILGAVEDAPMYPGAVKLNGVQIRTDSVANLLAEYIWLMDQLPQAEAQLSPREQMKGEALAKALDAAIFSSKIPVQGTIVNNNNITLNNNNINTVDSNGVFATDADSIRKWQNYVAVVNYAVQLLKQGASYGHINSGYNSGDYEAYYSGDVGYTDADPLHPTFNYLDESGNNAAFKPATRQEEYEFVLAQLPKAENMLKLKTLSEYTHSSYSGATGYSAILEQMRGEINALKATTYEYWSFENNTLVKVENADAYNSAALVAIDDALTAFVNKGFADTDTYYSEAENLTNAINTYRLELETAKTSANPINNSAWEAMCAQVRANLGLADSVTGNALVTAIADVYDGFDIMGIAAIINNYNNANNGTVLTINSGTTTNQQLVNDYTVQLKSALDAAYKVKALATKATEVVNAATSEGKFNVYDYAHDNQGAFTNMQSDSYTPESLAELQTQANAIADTTFSVLTTSQATITGKADEIAALGHGGANCVLVNQGAVTTYLEKAKAYAQNLLDNKSAEAVYYDDNSLNITYDKYTAESMAQLQFLINKADALLADADKTSDRANQWELDRMTFALYDEADDSLDYMLRVDDYLGSDYITWQYDENGAITAVVFNIDETDVNTFFYGERAQGENGQAYGLVLVPAKYTLLTAEINHHDPQFSAADSAVKVWDVAEDGTVTLVKKANDQYAGADIFNNWDAYVAAYEESKAFNTGYMANEQSLVNAQAEKMHNAYKALALKTFASNPAFATAQGYAAQLNAMLTATANINTYTVSADKGTTAIEEVAVYLYTNLENDEVRTAFTTAIDNFTALYADQNTTEDYFSEEAMETAYANIVDNIINGENPIELRNMSDEIFYAGENSLADNFIAGTWNGSTYSTILLKDTQKARINELLTAIEANKVDTALSDVTALRTAIGVLNNSTKALYDYTISTVATDLQFAEKMKSNLFSFYEMQITISSKAAYYYQSTTPKLYIFDQEMVQIGVKDKVNDYLGVTANWPNIYQVNGITYDNAKAGTGDVNGFTYADGVYTRTDSSQATVIDDLLINLFEQVSSHSVYYSYAFDYANSLNLDSLGWIAVNAMFTTDEGYQYIVSNPTLTDGYPKAYKPSWAMSNGVYKDKGIEVDGQKYYPYVVDYESPYYVNKDYTYNTTGGWFKDDKKIVPKDIWNGLQTYLGDAVGTDYDRYYETLASDTIFGDWAKTAADAGKANHYKALQNIIDNGWSNTEQNNVKNRVNALQVAIEGTATKYYNQISNLLLLPATDAYRQVATLYLSVMGKKPDYSKDTSNSIFYVGLNDENLTHIDGAFYHTSGDSDFFSILTTITGKAESEYAIDEFSGLRTGSTSKLPGYYAQDENMTALNDFYNSLSSTTAVTIDSADEIIGAQDTSLLKQMYALINELCLRSFDFTDLNRLVAAFLNNQETSGGKVGPINAFDSTFRAKYGLAKQKYYAYNYYTEQSLANVAMWLGNLYGVIDASVYSQIYTLEGNTPVLKNFKFNFIYDPDSHQGTFYSTLEYSGKNGQEAVDLITEDFGKQIDTLVLKDADKTGLLTQIQKADVIIAKESIYDRESEAGLAAWQAFISAKTEAEAVSATAGLTLAEDQTAVDAATQALTDAMAVLVLIEDKTAPELSLSTTAASLANFYENKLPSNYDDYSISTFVLPNSSGYSMVVYTNKLNPRILLNLEDLDEQMGDDAFITAEKGEQIVISATRTSGTVPNVITGVLEGADYSLKDGTLNTQNVAKLNSGGGQGPATLTNTSTNKQSALFAILAPNFVEGTKKQAALYKIKAADGKNLNPDSFKLIDVDGSELESIVGENVDEIDIYIYYMNNMLSDGSDEGVNNGVLTGAPVVYMNDENTGAEEWKPGVSLYRTFNGPSNWEFVSSIQSNRVNEVAGVPVYNDPSFGEMNTGSFAYVLDSYAEDGLDREVFDAYHSAKATDSAHMDYAAASAAKEAIIEAITAPNSSAFENMKNSDRFIEYGAGANWAQSLQAKYPNGTLIFVHVVDRWGNVCNRVIEIVRVDRHEPVVTNGGAGLATVTESGGSGIKSIDVWDCLSTESNYVPAEIQLADDKNQTVNVDSTLVGLNTTVETSGNVITVSGLKSGIVYYIGVADNAGRVGRNSVRADADGKIAITVTDEGETDSVQKTEAPVAITTMSFTMNDFAVVELNSIEASSVINAEVKGNVLADRKIYHYIDTQSDVTGLKIENVLTGEVDEWTTSAARVKTNSDGTLNWQISRTLTEGEHSFRVYAKTDADYEEKAVPFTISATTKTVQFTQNILGLGYTYLNYSGSKRNVLTTTYSTETIPYGAEVTLRALVNKTDREFKYWVNNSTNRIVGMDEELSFKAVSNVDYVAQFTSNASYFDGKKVVVYVNNAGNIINTYELGDGDSYAIPSAPQLPDYEFVRWNMSQAEVLASDSDLVIVRPVYKLSAINTVTLTQGNYTVSGGGEYSATDTERAIASINASATNEAGENFLYWYDEEAEAIASYSRVYSFYVLRDITLTPVYGEPNSAAQPAIRIADVRYDANTNKVTFYAERSIPNEYTVLQTGIVVTKTEEIAASEEAFVLGGTNTAAGTSTSTASNGYYSAAVSAPSGVTVWARGYVICETASGDIIYIYSPIASYSAE